MVAITKEEKMEITIKGMKMAVNTKVMKMTVNAVEDKKASKYYRFDNMCRLYFNLPE